MPCLLRNPGLSIRAIPGNPSSTCAFAGRRGHPRTVADVRYAAAALRSYTTGTDELIDQNGNPDLDDSRLPIEKGHLSLLNMTTGTAADCGEWTIYDAAQTVLVTAKLMSKTQGGLVGNRDIVNTMAGSSTEAVVNCGTDGG